MPDLKKTKIMCTLGPSSQDKETILKMIEAGMDAARLNFSHGDEKEKEAKIKILQEINQTRSRPITIIADLKGPEIRTDTSGKSLDIKTDDAVFFTNNKDLIQVDKVPFTIYIDLNEISPKKGSKIMVDDGLLEFEIVGGKKDKIECIAQNSGQLGHRKGVNIPHTYENRPTFTDKDWNDIDTAVRLGTDFLALSFVKSAKDIFDVREKVGNKIRIIAKVEHQKAVDNINEIIDASDAVMVARGDLGVEVPLERVPVIQYEIVKKCNFIGKPVIVATHMLNSMIDNPRPTRAEVTDVSNAIMMGADVVMLSGETANGKYPVKSVEMMNKIAISMEKEVRNKINRFSETDVKDIPTTVGRAVAMTAHYSNSAAIINITETGEASRMLSRYRVQSPIYVLTTNNEICRKLSLMWGVFPYKLSVTGKIEDVMDNGIRFLIDKNKIKKGDLVVITANLPSSDGSQRNIAEVRKV